MDDKARKSAKEAPITKSNQASAFMNLGKKEIVKTKHIHITYQWAISTTLTAFFCKCVICF
jgi:hypothetical protein